MVFKIINATESKAKIAYSILKERILTGEYQYGQILSANSLAKDLLMSRTPILDAFKQLESENFVTVSPKVGIIVNPINIDNILERHAVLAVLNGYMAGEAAIKGTIEEKRKLRALNDGIINRLEDTSTFEDLNREFHQQIMVMAKNNYVKQLMEPIQSAYTGYLGFRKNVLSQESEAQSPQKGEDIVKYDYKLKSWEEHEDIVKSIMEENTERARRAMEQHILRSRERFLSDFLKEEISGFKKRY